MKRLIGLVLTLLLILMLAGCGFNPFGIPGPGGDSNTTDEDNPVIEVIVENASLYVFDEVYIVPSSSGEWGVNLLGGDSLKVNDNMTFVVAGEEGDFDVRIVDEDSDEYLFYGIPFEDGGCISIRIEAGVPAADVFDASGDQIAMRIGELVSPGGQNTNRITFYFENGSHTSDFYELYIYEHGSDNQGYNHLASIGYIGSGDGLTIGVDNYIWFDILLIDEAGYGWIYDSVLLEEDCFAYVTSHNGVGLTVDYADGSSIEYHGDYS